MFILCLDNVDLAYVLGGAQNTLKRKDRVRARGARGAREEGKKDRRDNLPPPSPTPRVLMRLISLSQHLLFKLQSATKLVETLCL